MIKDIKYKTKLRWLVRGTRIKRYIILAVLGVAIVGISCFAVDERHYKILLFVVGQLIAMSAFLIVIAKLWRSSPKGMTWVTRADQMYRETKLDNGPKVVAIGGGTGLSSMLRAIKKITSNITAVVTVADNGGNSGVLRKELGVIPPGDIRNCVIALSSTESTMEELLSHRFTEGSLNGYCLGNLFLVAMSELSGGFLDGIQKASEVLAVTGQVLPVTMENVHLAATMDDGREIVGEELVGIAQREHGGCISSVFLEPDNCVALPNVLEAIEDADIVLIGPGSLYTSIIPNLLVPKVVDSIIKSKAQKIYISNLMTQPGETEGYNVSQHVSAIERHACKNLFTHIVVNDNIMIRKEVYERYQDELSKPVELDENMIGNSDYILVKENLIEEVDERIRHSMSRLASCIERIYKDSQR